MIFTKARTQKLRQAVKTILCPALSARGYEAQKHSSLFYNFVHIGDERITGLQIQWDKYHRPCFIMNFAFAPLTPGENGGAGFYPVSGQEQTIWQPAAGINNRLDVHMGRLHHGRKHEKWFLHSLFAHICQKDAEIKLAQEAATLIDHLESWITAADLNHEYMQDHIIFFPRIIL